jgi:hypothetical protein
MQQTVRILNAGNIGSITKQFHAGIAAIGQSVQGKTGVALFHALKREKLIGGPYPGVSLFEAANRIMSDLVILGGVAALLEKRVFPFTSYTVEFGNEDRNGFDIRATAGGETLVGEAFNVAPSFYQGKKNSALKKLRKGGSDASYRILMFNDDAVSPGYAPKAEAGFYHLLVGVDAGTAQLRPHYCMAPAAAPA